MGDRYNALLYEKDEDFLRRIARGYCFQENLERVVFDLVDHETTLAIDLAIEWHCSTTIHLLYPKRLLKRFELYIP
jgi:hypothetical protein